MNQRIPNIILQTGKSAALPLLNRAVVTNIRCLNPGFQYRFFDDHAVVDFIEKEFPSYRTIFDNFKFKIQRYDFFRYLAVFRYGGFYLDLDVLLAKSLLSLGDHSCIFPFEDLNISLFLRRQHHIDWTIGNYAFGASPEHPFLKAVIENCVRAQQAPEWIEPALRGIPRPFVDEFVVLNTTGPLLLARTLAENPSLYEHISILFPTDVRDPTGWHCFGDIGIHLMEGSWRPKQRGLKRRLRILWESRLFNRLMKESAALGPKRPAYDSSRRGSDIMPRALATTPDERRSH